MLTNTELQLSGSPYLIESDAPSSRRLEKAREKSVGTRERIIATNERIRDEAHEILGPYIASTRMDLVTESNLIEGMSWGKHQVRDVIYTHQSLLNGPIHSLTETVRADPKLYEVLGLYRAHEIADTWFEEDHVPRAADIRALHHLILGDVRNSGSYKEFDNQIAGRADHRTTTVTEVPRVMLELTDWWANQTGDPLLTATAVHAWLAHVHPFTDGNGRIARILANIELARHNYPPLILRASDDRGQYYSALQASDDGDLLPLYELFERAIRRQAKIMARPGYVGAIINDRLLATELQKYNLWQSTLDSFTAELAEECRYRGLRFALQGTLGPDAFGLLADRDSDGNGWYATISAGSKNEWLLWFGFRSDAWLAESDSTDDYPSIFISRRDADEDAVHPFNKFFDMSDLATPAPNEIHIVPAQYKTILLRWDYRVDDYRPKEAAAQLLQSLDLQR